MSVELNVLQFSLFFLSDMSISLKLRLFYDNHRLR